MNDEEATMLRRAAATVLEECGRPIQVRRADALYSVPGWALTALELALDGRDVDACAVIRSHGRHTESNGVPTEGI
jgi:hypothetical protein|tara:strand:- start:1964 stop:2191 length:228 start_codon:yes stop_codon:yes gene_type:complete